MLYIPFFYEKAEYMSTALLIMLFNNYLSRANVRTVRIWKGVLLLLGWYCAEEGKG